MKLFSIKIIQIREQSHDIFFKKTLKFNFKNFNQNVKLVNFLI